MRVLDRELIKAILADIMGLVYNLNANTGMMATFNLKGHIMAVQVEIFESKNHSEKPIYDSGLKMLETDVILYTSVDEIVKELVEVEKSVREIFKKAPPRI